MKPEQLLAMLGEKIADISGPGGADIPWCAAQWRTFSKETNLLISEQWETARCDHAAERFNTAEGQRCGLCMRKVE
jgi:hypothetical protein